MKKILASLMIAAGLLFAGTLQAQVVNIPGKSKEHFTKKYPGATNSDWHNNVANYTCRFQWNSGEYKAYYHMDGTWDYTVQYLKEPELPKAVQEAVAKSRIAGWEPKSAAFVENHKGLKTYRVERKKGVEEIFIFFDKNGKEVKSTVKI
jgi:hypothetical protein